MPFRVPAFPLLCNVWRRGNVPAGPVISANLPAADASFDCQLRAPGKQSTAQDEGHYWAFHAMLLVPALTDLRDSFSWDGVAMNLPDLVEVPKGSERYYTVVYVDDVAKGFPNEYRFAMLLKNPYAPIPLP